MLAHKPQNVVNSVEENKYNDPYDKMMAYMSDKSDSIKLVNAASTIGDDKISNIKLDDIKQNNISSNNILKFTENNIYISFNKATRKFILKECNKSHSNDKVDHPEPITLGSFDHIDLIKNISDVFDHDNKFIPDRLCNQLSRNMVGYLVKNADGYNIFIHNINSSPIMGDIETLVRLNEYLKDYEENVLEEDLKKVDNLVAHKIKKYVKLFIYTLLGYTVTLISENFNSINEKFRNSYMKYIVFSTYRIASYSQDLHTEYKVEYVGLKENLKTINGIKELIKNKLTTFNDQIKLYNDQIKQIINKPLSPTNSQSRHYESTKRSPIPYYINNEELINQPSERKHYESTKQLPIPYYKEYQSGGRHDRSSSSSCSTCSSSSSSDRSYKRSSKKNTSNKSHSYISEMYDF